jgi:hypothetical protein
LQFRFGGLSRGLAQFIDLQFCQQQAVMLDVADELRGGSFAKGEGTSG